MSTVTLTMPRLGETMEEGTVSNWLVNEGESFVRGAPLVEFETDKTAVEYPALGPGRLARTLVRAGDVVKLGEPIAEIDLEGADDWVGGGENAAGTGKAGPEASQNGGTVVTDLLMPRLGETMEEGTISSWLVGEGEHYDRGTPILDIETDKTVAEFPALFPARLVEIVAQPGEVVPVGHPIARIEVHHEHAAQAPEPDFAPEAADGDATPVAAEVAQRPRPSGGLLRATPLARRAARKAGVDLADLHGSGRRGRIELCDVEANGRSAIGNSLSSTTYGPEGPARVILIHGFAGDRTTLDQLAMGLGRVGLPARAIDLPGHGETQAEAPGFDDLVAALQNELAGKAPAHLVGHSLGAAAAVRAVAKGATARSLTLIAPAGLGPAIDGDFVVGMAQPVSVGATGHLLRRLSARAANFSEQMVRNVHDVLASGRLTALAADIAAGDRQRIDVVPDLARLAEKMPVRIILGHRDSILDWRDALAVSPRIAIHHFPDAGHMPHWDAPDAVRDLLAKELNDE